MKLKDKVKAALPPLPGGTYQAICIGVVDIGTQFNKIFQNSSRKVVFIFELPSEAVLVDGIEQPRQLSKRCTFSVSKKSTLYALLNSWTNASMDETELQELDLFSLIGCSCFINVSISKDCQYNNIENIMSLPKGIPPLQSNTPVIRYDMDTDGFEGDIWDSLPEWVKNRIRQSEEYQEAAPDTVLPAHTEEEKTDGTGQLQNHKVNQQEEKKEETPTLYDKEPEIIDTEEECPF